MNIHEVNFSEVSLRQLRTELMDTLKHRRQSWKTDFHTERALIHSLSVERKAQGDFVYDMSGYDSKISIDNKYLLALVIYDLKGRIDSIVEPNAKLLKEENPEDDITDLSEIFEEGELSDNTDNYESY